MADELKPIEGVAILTSDSRVDNAALSADGCRSLIRSVADALFLRDLAERLDSYSAPTAQDIARLREISNTISVLPDAFVPKTGGDQ